jgi:hypothetical protein
MMQPAEDEGHLNAVAEGQLMAMDTGRNLWLGGFRNARSEGRMRSAAIVVEDPLTKDALQMSFAEWNQVVSRHSRRMVPISRSQKGMACGARTGVLRTRTLKPRRAESTSSEKIASRS